MKILVWGLGYVGTVTAGCLAHLGYDVVGIEPNAAKLEKLNAGFSPVRESGLDSIISRAVANGRLRAVPDGTVLVPSADVSLVCVSSPSEPDGSLKLEYACNVVSQIGAGLRYSNQYHCVAIRSTVAPGTVRNVVAKTIEKSSGKLAGRDFGLAMNPEFTRETTAVADFLKPPYTIIGEFDQRSGDVLEQLYKPIDGPIYRVCMEEAEFLKLCNNAFHAVKIGFSNEIARLCDRLGIDSSRIMKLVCADTQLNISAAYLTPGFAFGGSCLPKDMQALMYYAGLLGVDLPILKGVLPSNDLEIGVARSRILATGARRVGILGLSFKPYSDDLRDSPIVRLICDLQQDGVDFLVYDPDVKPDEILGSNRDYLDRHFPQVDRLLCNDLKLVLERSQIIVLAQKRTEFLAALNELAGQVPVLDLVRTATFPR